MKRHPYALPCVLIGTVILAAFLRFLYLGRESLWLDEAVSVASAQLDWHTSWTQISRFAATMAFYHLLLHGWIHLGKSEFIVRSLSAVVGVATILPVYALGKRTLGSKPGIIGALLLAASPFHIKYSQEARGYTLVVLLATLSSLLFIRAIENQFWYEWALYTLTSTLMLYTHFFGVFVLGAQLISLVVLDWRNVPWQKLLISIGGIGFFSAPLAVFVATSGMSQIAWVPRPRLYDIYALFKTFAGGGWRLLLVYFAFCFISLLLAAKGWFQSKASFETWHYAFLWIWLSFPVLAAFAISLLKPMFVARYLLICLPPLVLLAASGLSRIRSGWLLAGGLVVVLTMSGRRIVWQASHLEKEDWRGAASYVVSNASPKDGILFYLKSGNLCFDYYVRGTPLETPPWRTAFPDPWDWQKGWNQADPDSSSLALLPKRYDRVWLFLSHNEATRERQERTLLIERSLAANYSDVREQIFRGVRVLRYSRGEHPGSR